jgi:nucleoside-diphosphate-sugar epimerase
MTATSKKESEKKDPISLVAGGAGFIGSYLCETLLAQNFRVYCLDNLSSGSKDNIKSLLTNPNFHFIEADITQPLEILDSLEEVQSIFHLAALEVGKDQKKFSLETLLVNSTGTRSLLEAAKKFQAKFILVSSGDIYQGSFSSNSLKYFFGGEEQEAVMSQNEAKRFAEALTVEYFKNYQLDAAIVRVKDVYGPRMNLGVQNELTELIGQAKTGERLLVEGDGLKTLNPTYVSDVVFGLVKVLVGDYKGEVFNLISSEKTTQLGLAETLRLISGKLEIVHEPDEQKISFPPPALDLENTQGKLKWSPRVTLAEGLSSVFQSFREVEPAKMVSLPLPTEEFVHEVSKPKLKTDRRWNKPLRLTIFLASLILILFTTVVPFITFIFSSQEASNKLVQASEKLAAEEITQTTNLATEASEKGIDADRSLNNIRWLFQLSGQRDSLRANEQLLFSLRNGADGLKLLSQVSNGLIEAEEETDLIRSQELLRSANQLLIEARQSLDLAKANLSQVNSDKLAVGLKEPYSKVKSINEEAVSAAEAINSSLISTLKKIEDASTVP